MTVVTHRLTMDVAGLHRVPTIGDLMVSSNAYNQLPDDGEQPAVSEDNLDALAAIFCRHNMWDRFGLHLVHGHFQIAADKVMLGSAIGDGLGYWTKPTSIRDVNLDLYREGQATSWSAKDATFLQELIEYLRTHNLSKLLGLQILAPGEPGKAMVEFVLGGNCGTVMLDHEKANFQGAYRNTGWRVERSGDKPVFIELEKHAKTIRGTHQVFTDPDDKNIPDEAALRSVLKAEELVKCE
ncbi:hypothetical protein CEP52_016813 [Fusarium oligoseptatum]|uniref:Uncharacterized protein n=1 Tax=Fusarium oligoseptatum TaxID=2604345 RepID=A0A428RZT7_9HYPO|nr:hypothetical protein CEP52_016813 [Fusarium oligoseptatum]